MRLLWLKRIRRRDYIYEPVNFIFVCSKHFKPSDYQTGRMNGMRYLKEGAVPSVFEWDFTNNKINDPTATEATPPNLTLPQNPQRSTEDVIELTPPNLVLPEYPEHGRDQECDAEDIVSTVVSDIVSVVASTETCIPVLECNGTCRCCEKSKTDEELEKCIAELKLKVAVQKQLLEVQDYKLRKMKKDLKEAERQAEIAEKRLAEIKPSIARIKDNNKDIAFYTGMPSFEKLYALFHRLNPGENGENINVWKRGTPRTSPAGRPQKLDVEDQFLLVLMRLRLGLFIKDLADRFGIAPSTASNYCITWINFMYLRLGQINIWSTREQIDETMPEDFKREYPSTRVILDATELKCQSSKSLVLQSSSYSNYKSTTTYKGLVGISPNGYVTFVSHLFTGCISDQELTRRSGFLRLKFSPGDSVMADKGFLIEKMLNKIDVQLNIPPFLGEKGQFTKEELQKSQTIASLRIHVERRISRIRGFHILDRPIPLTLAPVINQLWTVVTLLSNFQAPLIRKISNLNDSSLEDDDFYEEILAPGILTPSNDLDDFQEEILEPENACLDDEFSEWSDSNSEGSGMEDNIPPTINLDTSLDESS